MGKSIHASALVNTSAEIGDGVTIGPYCVVGGDVRIGEGAELDPHVVVESGSRIGRNCRIGPGTVIGGPPQDLKYKGEKTFVVLGDNCVVRECVTLHRAVGEGASTKIGSDNFFMAYAHVGHNCEIGSNNIFSSYVGLAGHVSVENNVVMGGYVGAHQYSRVGKMAMIGAFSKINQDIPPFMLADGIPAKVVELNRIGLKRSGISAAERSTLRQAYKLLYRMNLNRAEAIERIEEELEHSPELVYLLNFLQGTFGSYGGRGNEPVR